VGVWRTEVARRGTDVDPVTADSDVVHLLISVVWNDLLLYYIFYKVLSM